MEKVADSGDELKPSDVKDSILLALDRLLDQLQVDRNWLERSVGRTILVA